MTACLLDILFYELIEITDGFYFYLYQGREGQLKLGRERSSIFLFTAQVAAVPGCEAGWDQERNSILGSTWLMEDGCS